MSSTPTVTVTLLTKTDPLPVSNAAYASTTIALTDAAGNVQTASVNGTESPAWTAVFQNVAAGGGSISAQPIDASGAAIGAPATQSFTETGAPATFPAVASITVTIGAPTAAVAKA